MKMEQTMDAGSTWIVRLVFSIAIAMGMWSHAHAQSVIAQDRQALLDLYNATGGPNWRQQTNWGSADNECAWYGVLCDGDRVLSLSLSNNNLTGTLPSTLNHLTKLSTLYVYDNQISGAIPKLTGLTNLAFFQASNNQLSGAIPSLSDLPSLIRFEVGTNQLSGSIPTLTGLSQLSSFSVENNRLSGTIPSLSNLQNLLRFNVSNNQLSGSLPALSGLSGLWGFYAQNNQLSGSIPTLSDLPKFVEINVSNNQLSGSIPSLSNLPSFRAFLAENNQLSGTIPPLLGIVERFKASHNQLSGEIPSLQQNILTFAASHNKLSGSIPPLVGLTRLEHFDVSNNQLSGEIPVLFGFGMLRWVIFDVSDNQLSGPVPWAPIRLFRRIYADQATSSICNNDLISSGSSARDATWGSEWQACQRPKSTPSAELRVNLVGTSSAQIDSSTGHGGSGNYALTVTPNSTVQLSAPLNAGSQVFSHWVGCNIKSNTASTYFNECELLMPASGSKRVTAVYTSPNSKLINISTRAKVLTGDHVLIAGFVISGGPKKVLIKAAGPSLNMPNSNTLSNPMLTLFSGSTPLASNDDWESADNAAAIRASGIAPTHPKEAALLTTLQPGAYTVIVQGVAGGTGIGLVSVDDLDAFDSSSRLINISSRAYTSAGGDDEQMIAGFVLRGDPKELFVVGAGPSMTKYGVPDVLLNPYSSLHSGSSMLSDNDDWNMPSDMTQPEKIDIRLVSEITPEESAIVQTLPQGAYTLIMRGVGRTGIGLISIEE